MTSSRKLDWWMCVLALWPVFGAYLDAWAHTNIPSMESFFTPWHAVLYSGLIINTLAFVYLWMRAGWRFGKGRGMPAAYETSLVGCLIFLVGGILDMAWHLAFGIEHDFEALLSPTHLVLMVGVGVIAAGPLRASWQRGDARLSWPGMLSAAGLLSMLTFFGQFDHPYTSQWAAGVVSAGYVPDQVAEMMGVLGILYQTFTLLGVMLLLVRRARVPLGGFTVLFTINAVFVTMIHHLDPVIFVALVGGLLSDALYMWLRPSAERTLQFRNFAAVATIPLFTLYFIGLNKVDGVWWPVHIWVGSIMAAAISGWLLSYLLLPDQLRTQAH